MSAGTAAAADHARWIAYDEQAKEAENMEIEPGNTRQRSMTWSDDDQMRACTWRGCGMDTRSPSITAVGSFAASLLPHRILTFEDTSAEPLRLQRRVAFVPASFRDLPSAALTSARSSALRSLLSAVSSADALSTDAHGRFRLLWILARDAPRLQSPQRMRSLRKHSNLFAPIETHDPKALAARMLAYVLPSPQPAAPAAATSSSSAASSDSAASPPVSLPRSRLQEFLLESESAVEDGVGLLPQTPLRCSSLDDPDALSIEVLETLVHAQMCLDLDWSIDARSWASVEPESASASWTAALQVACAKVLRWVVAHFSERAQYAQLVCRCYRELMPPRRVITVLDCGLPFDWLDPSFQSGIVRAILRPGLDPQRQDGKGQGEEAAEEVDALPPSVEHAWSFWSALSSHIESEGACIEVHAAIVKVLADLLRAKTQQALKPQAVPAASHWTVTYRHGVESEGRLLDRTSSDSKQTEDQEEEPQIELRTCTLRMEFGFSSTTGLSLWPAGFLMCDFILQHPQEFAGKRVLELGVGIGFTSVMLHRAGASTLVCTDGDEQVVENLHTNFRINGLPPVSSIVPISSSTSVSAVSSAASSSSDPSSSSSSSLLLPPGVYAETLNWSAEDRGELLRRAAPDVIVSCDTIYLPEFHEALASVLREALEPTSSVAESSPSPPARVAFFTQVNRNPQTFASYLATFARHGLRMEPVPFESLPSRFAYDRDCVNFHKITLNADVAKQE